MYQSGLRLQAKQLNFELKGVYSCIRLLTKPKGRPEIQVPKLHRIKGQPGSGQNPAPSSTSWRERGCPGGFLPSAHPLRQLLATLISSTVSLSFCILSGVQIHPELLVFKCSILPVFFFTFSGFLTTLTKPLPGWCQVFKSPTVPSISFVGFQYLMFSSGISFWMWYEVVVYFYPSFWVNPLHRIPQTLGQEALSTGPRHTWEGFAYSPVYGRCLEWN